MTVRPIETADTNEYFIEFSSAQEEIIQAVIACFATINIEIELEFNGILYTTFVDVNRIPKEPPFESLINYYVNYYFMRLDKKLIN